MKKMMLPLLAALMAPAILSGEEMVFAPQRAEYVKIDGKLDEAAWKNAKFVKSFKIMGTQKAPVNATEVAVINTDTEIIFGFRAHIPASEVKDAKLFAECVEVMIDPQGGSGSYYHFALGHNGLLFDRSCDQGGYVSSADYESNFRAARQKGKDFWTAEIAVPFHAIELYNSNKEYWSVNCARESSQISAIGKDGYLNVKDAFVKMAPPQLDWSIYKLQPAEPVVKGSITQGKLAADYQISVKNLSGKDQVVIPSLLFTAPDGKCRKVTLLKKKMAADSETVFKVPTQLFDKSGKYTIDFMLRDDAAYRQLVEKRFVGKLEFIPLAIQLIDPHYRQAIFATQKLDKVRFAVEASDFKKDMKMRGSIRVAGAKTSLVKSEKAIAKKVNFEFPVASLPEGRLEVVAELLSADGKVAAATVTPIRKLEYRKGEVWRGKDRNWYIDGKKVFLLLSWNVKDFYFPEFTAVMTNSGKYPHVRSMTPMGFGLVSKGFGLRKVLAKQGITPAAEAFFRKRVAEYMKPENVFAHYWVDEPDCSGLSRESAAKVAAIAADVDPWHPVVISTGTKGVVAYPDCGEINGFHCYPHPKPGIPMSNFKKIVICMDIAAEYFKDKVDAQTITFLHQGFNYGDHGSRNSRIPSYEEYRTQNLLALILGAQGLLHYNVFRGDYPEIYVGMPLLVKEQKVVGEEAVIQEPLPVKSPTKSLRLRAFKNPATGKVWLLACNVEYEAAEYDIDLKEFGNAKLNVLSENRTVKAQNGKFRDKFRGFEVHVYTTDMRDFGLKTVKAIENDIEEAYRKRAKPGNLVWQRIEGEKLEVNASSNANRDERDPFNNQLWHVTDGVIQASSPRGGCEWRDNTPKQVPDWISLDFRKSTKVGRVVVYPAANSLADFEVQLKKGSDWKTVGQVKDFKGEKQEFVFESQSADAVRIFVTRNYGKNSSIAEIEVYEK